MVHHYVVDLYYPEDKKPDRFRREVLRIAALDDGEAVAEGLRISGWRHPNHYRVRAIKTSARSGDVILFETQPQVEESAEADQQ